MSGMIRTGALALLVAAAACGGPEIELSAKGTPEAVVLGDSVKLEATTTPAADALAVSWKVTKAPDGSHAAIADDAKASATFAPDLAGTYELTVTAQDPTLRTGGGIASLSSTRKPVSAKVTITAAPRPPASIAFRVQPTDIVAGAAFSPSVEVVVLDSVGGVVEAATNEVTLTLDAPTGSAAKLLGTATRAAQAGHTVFADASVDLVGEGYTLTASATGLGTAKSSAFKVVAGAPDKAHSTFTALPATATVGTGTVALTLELRDAYGNAVADAQGSFSVDGSANQLNPASGATDANGRLAGTLTSTKAEAKHLTATFTGGPLEATVTFLAGPPDKDHSTIVIEPATVTADGTTTATVTVIVRDAYGNPVPGATVDVTATGSGNTLDPSNGTTGSDGVLVTTMTSTHAEPKTVTATVGGWSIDGTVTFLPGAPDEAHTTLAAAPQTVTANGVATTTVTVRVADAFDNPVPGIDVTPTATGSGNTLAPDGAIATDAAGQVQFTLASTKAEEKSVGATIAGFSKEETVTFVAGAPDKAHSSLAIAPSTVEADGSTKATITVTVRDAQDNPVSGVSTSFSASGTLNTLAPATGTTGADGVVTATIASKKAEAKTVTATFASLQLTGNVTFTTGAPVAANSTFTASPTTLVANNTATSTLTATLKDANGNLVSGATVTFSATGSGNTLSGTSATTNAAGVATVTLKSTVAEAKTATASFGASQTLTANVTFTAGPPDAAHTTFTATPTTQVADDVALSAFTLTVRDAFGNPVSGATVTITASGTSHTINGAGGITPASGALSGSIRTPEDGVKTLTATITLGSTTITKTVQITFTEAPPVILSITPPASMSSCATLSYVVKQVQGRPVDVRVEYDTTGSGLYVSATRHTSQGDGLAALTASAAGVSHTFVWNTTTDVPHRTVTTARVKITPSRNGVDGTAFTVTAQTVANDLSFGTPMGLSAQVNTNGVIAGDFNGDGRPDLAAANQGSSSVSILLNNGGMTFASAVNYTVGGTPYTLAKADFNNDGKLDLVTGNNASGNASVLIGKGDGTFNAAVNYAAGGGPMGVAVADFNRDGRADFAVSNNSTNNVSVFLGKGDGTFNAAANYGSGGTNAIYLAAGDLNRDGIPDLAVTNFSPPALGILLGNGDGTFKAAVAYTTASGPRTPVIGDFNRDGKPDVAVATAGAISFFAGNGDGTFGTPSSIPAGGFGMVAADLDQDGKLDLASTAGNAQNIILGKGDGTFRTPFTVGSSVTSYGITAADLDGDGRVDLASADWGSNKVTVLPNTTAYRCDPGFRTAATYTAPASAVSIAQADFDNDGRMDIVSVGLGVAGISWGNADGTFNTAEGFPVTVAGIVQYPGTAVTVGDFNRDGWPDLALTSSTASAKATNVAVVLLNTKSRTFAATAVYSASTGTAYPYSITAGDMNGDGILDLVVPRVSDGTIGVLLGAADGTFGAVASSGFAYGSRPVAALVDLDRDTKPDLVVSGNSATVQKNNGAASLTQTYVSDIQLFMDSISGDFNRDGWPDGAVASDNAGNPLAVRILLNNKAGGVTATNIGGGFNSTGLASWDVDGDGVPDFVTPGKNGNVAVHFMTAATALRATQQFPAGSTTLGDIVMGDYDADGIPDAVVMDTSGALRVLMGR